MRKSVVIISNHVTADFECKLSEFNVILLPDMRQSCEIIPSLSMIIVCIFFHRLRFAFLLCRLFSTTRPAAGCGTLKLVHLSLAFSRQYFDPKRNEASRGSG